MKRQIISIDEMKCTGCGDCVIACAEGALQIVNGKARVVAEILCDGLGACMGGCPEGALTVEMREAPAFDEQAVAAREQGKASDQQAVAMCQQSKKSDSPDRGSLLGNWPVQLRLISPSAAHLQACDLLIAADCVPVAYRTFQEDFLDGRTVVIACPKLDDRNSHYEKLVDIFRTAKPRSIRVIIMEVGCCHGLTALVRQAADFAGIDAPIENIVISVDGGRKE